MEHGTRMTGSPYPSPVRFTEIETGHEVGTTRITRRYIVAPGFFSVLKWLNGENETVVAETLQASFLPDEMGYLTLQLQVLVSTQHLMFSMFRRGVPKPWNRWPVCRDRAVCTPAAAAQGSELWPFPSLAVPRARRYPNQGYIQVWK